MVAISIPAGAESFDGPKAADQSVPARAAPGPANSGGKGKSHNRSTAPAQSNIDFDAANTAIIAGLNIASEYRAMGVIFTTDSPRSSGVMECYAVGRDEARPSAMVNISTGRYVDKGSDENLSLWDFAAKYGKIGDWQAARQHFATKAGVDLSTAGAAAKSNSGGKRKKAGDWVESLEFADWTEGNLNLAETWCRKWKEGTSVEAIRDAGGRIAYYPCYRDKDTGEKKRGKYKCIALPCYGDKILTTPPEQWDSLDADGRPTAKSKCIVAWVLWNINGKPIERFKGKGIPPDECKMLSVGPTRGAMMGRAALELVVGGNSEIEMVHTTGGPSDMLVLATTCPPEQRRRHPVVTNASSETGDVLPWQVSLFSDYAGGAWKVTLPFVVKKKSGKDVRDYLNGAPAEI